MRIDEYVTLVVILCIGLNGFATLGIIVHLVARNAREANEMRNNRRMFNLTESFKERVDCVNCQNFKQGNQLSQGHAGEIRAKDREGAEHRLINSLLRILKSAPRIYFAPVIGALMQMRVELRRADREIQMQSPHRE